MINIGLVNEMALMCDRMGIDVWARPHQTPSASCLAYALSARSGSGGHASHPIPSIFRGDQEAGIEARFIELAGYINGQIPSLWPTRCRNALNDAGKPVKGSPSMSWAWRTSGTSPTCANRRRSTSCCC